MWNELNYELNKYQLKRTHILTANNGPEKTLHFAYMQPVKETRNPRTEPGMDSTFFLPRRKFRKSSSCAKDKSAALTTKTNRKLQFRLSSLWIEFFTLGANYRSRGNTECLLHMGLNIIAFCYQFFFFLWRAYMPLTPQNTQQTQRLSFRRTCYGSPPVGPLFSSFAPHPPLPFTPPRSGLR